MSIKNQTFSSDRLATHFDKLATTQSLGNVKTAGVPPQKTKEFVVSSTLDADYLASLDPIHPEDPNTHSDEEEPHLGIDPEALRCRNIVYDETGEDVDCTEKDSEKPSAEAIAAVIRAERTSVKTTKDIIIQKKGGPEAVAVKKCSHVSMPAAAAALLRHDPEAEAAQKLSKITDLGAMTEDGSLRTTMDREREITGMKQLTYANELYDKGDYISALAHYEQLCEEQPENTVARMNRGNCFKALHFHQEAAAQYEKLLQLVKGKPGHLMRLMQSFALNNLGAVYQDEKRYEEALARYTNALTINPQLHIASKNRGNVHMATAVPPPNPQIAPIQHELAVNDFNTTMDHDWQHLIKFNVGQYSVEHRVEFKHVCDSYVAHISINLGHIVKS